MKSLKSRLAGWSAGISGAILLVYVGGSTFELYLDMLDYVDAEIIQSGEHYLAEVARGSGSPRNFDAPVEVMILDDREYMTVLDIKSPSSLVYTRPGFREGSDASSILLPGNFTTTTLLGRKFRVGTVSKGNWSGSFAVEYNIITEEILESVATFFIVIPGVLLTAAFGGWWVGRMALGPIRRITRTAEAITASGLDRRLPTPRENGEITRLVEVLNSMLERLESSFRQASRFTADASHQLLTPLTILQSEIDSAVKSGTFGDEQLLILNNLMEEVDRLKIIVDSLLILSRSDAGNLILHREPVDLAGLLRELLEDAEVLGESVQLKVEGDLPGYCRVSADVSLLRQCLMNLLDNAVKYNRPGGRIHCQLAEDGNKVSIRIFNTGRAILKGAEDRIFDRFYRGFGAADSGARGFGLGLSLVLEIVKAHGGSIVLSRSVEDATEFTIVLPVAPSGEGSA